MAIARWKDFCIDAADAHAVARFWGEVLGLTIELHADGDAALRGERPEETIWINAVPEAKVVKNRVHWDITCDDVPGLIERGATVLTEPTESTPWHVLADPEGNEFCAFPSG